MTNNHFGIGKRRKAIVQDDKGSSEGRLFIQISDSDAEGEGAVIGDTKIYLDSIAQTGEGGGRRAVKLMFVGPRNVKISRFKYEIS